MPSVECMPIGFARWKLSRVIDDARFVTLWSGASRCYLLAYGSELPHLEQLVGRVPLHVVAESGGNYLLSNQPIP